jgi:hypothetical protein
VRSTVYGKVVLRVDKRKENIDFEVNVSHAPELKAVTLAIPLLSYVDIRYLDKVDIQTLIMTCL